MIPKLNVRILQQWELFNDSLYTESPEPVNSSCLHFLAIPMSAPAREDWVLGLNQLIFFSILVTLFFSEPQFLLCKIKIPILPFSTWSHNEILLRILFVVCDKKPTQTGKGQKILGGNRGIIRSYWYEDWTTKSVHKGGFWRPLVLET